MNSKFRTLALMIILSRHAVAASSFTTWEYVGQITHVPANTINLPAPIGLPVKIAVTFDATTPDTYLSPQVGEYLMSGGGTNITVQIGAHVSAPIDAFRITTIVDGCCAANDQYTFSNYGSQSGRIPIEFPGYLSGAELSFFFRNRLVPGGITSDALPTIAPVPAHFEDMRLIISQSVATQTGTQLLLSMQIINNLRLVPEPTAAACLIAVVFAALASGRR